MKTLYRITLLEHSNGLAETLATLAAKSNGGKYLTVHQLKSVADGQIILYPSINEETTCEVLDENTLHLDRKVRDNYETVLMLEQVAIMELAKEEAPTLFVHENGLLDKDREELIN